MLSIAQLSLVLMLVPLVAGIALVAAGGRVQRRTALGTAIVAALISLVAAVFVAAAILPNAPLLYNLLPFGKGALVERLDGFSVYLMLGIAAWVTPVLLWMTAPRGRVATTYPTSPRPLGLALLLESVALGAVLLDNVVLIALCWAGVGFFAWLMARPQEALRPSAPQEWIDLLLLTLGPILFVLTMIPAMAAGKTSSLYGMQGHALFGFWSGALVLLALGFAAGIYPFIIWVRRVAQGVLPEAVGALLLLLTPLAVTMAGRLLSVLTPTGSWPHVVVGPATITLNLLPIILGIITVVVAGVVLLFEQDLLVVTAMLSTVIVGWCFAAIGAGDNHALLGLVLLLLVQTLGIGTLMLVWSSLEWAERDLRLQDLAGLAREMPLHFAALALAGLALVGVPLFSGFAARLTIDQALLSLGGTSALAGALIWIGNALALVGVVRLISRALHETPGELAAPERVIPAREESLALIIPAALLLVFGIAPELLLIGSAANPGIAITAAAMLFSNTGLPTDITYTAFGFNTGGALWVPGLLWAMAVVAAAVVALTTGLTGSQATPLPAFAGGEPLPAEDHEPSGEWLDLAPLALSPWLLPGPASWRYDLADAQAWAEENDVAAEDEVIVIDEGDETLIVEDDTAFIDAADDDDEANVIDTDAVDLDDTTIPDEDEDIADDVDVPAPTVQPPPRRTPPPSRPPTTARGNGKGANRGKR